ncbi:MAG TPA: PAS domain S-box protein [Dermatophilaceae bacterium]|nr:PAS domain S-box protein [Dermatophilaceae bacterium]
MSPKTRFENLLEAVPDALVGMDQKGVIRFVNRQTESLFGYDRDQLIGQRIETLVPESLWQIYAEHRDDYFADPRARSTGLDLQLNGRQRDGTAFPIDISLSHIDTGDVLLVITAVREVNQRKQAIKNAQLVEAIVASSDVAIISSTLEGIITSWNPAAEQMCGYSSKEIIGRSGSLLTPRDRAGEPSALLEQVRNGQTVEHFESTLARKDGTLVPVSVTVAPIRDEGGAIVGASTIARDLTELKRAAQYARNLIETALDPLVTISPEGTINDVNEATVKATGVPRDELIGTDFTHYFSNPDRAREGYEQVFAQGSVTDYPLTLRHRNGALTDVLYNASVYYDTGGNVLGVFAAARDVTGQKKAFEASQRLASIVECSQDAIISGSLDGKITSWNPAAERLYGYSREEMVGKPADFLTPEDRAGEIKVVLEQIVAGRHVENLETNRVRKDGTVFPVSLAVSPIRDTEGAVVGTSVIHRDLTEQKRALASVQSIAAIVEYSNDAIIGRTLDGAISSWNPAAARMFGYTSEEIVGKSIDLLVPKERAGEMISILAKISAGRPVDNFETIRVRKDGTVFPVSLTISPICNERGAVVATSVIYRDVTELKHAARYSRSLIEASLDPLETISPDGKITDVNEAAVKASGVPRNKLIGTDFSQYFTDPDQAREGYHRVFEEGSVTDYPLTLRHRDGTLTDFLCNASVYHDPEGNVLGVVATVRDITRQKEAFEATERMASIVEYSDEAIISSTLDGIITSWNPAAARLYGYSSEEIIGKSIQPVAPKDRPDEIKDLLAKIKTGLRVEHFETTRVRKDGTVFPVSLTVSPIRGIDGAIVGTSVISREMTTQE